MGVIHMRLSRLTTRLTVFIFCICLLGCMGILLASQATPKAQSSWYRWKGSQATVGFSENAGNTTDTTLNSMIGLDYARTHLVNKAMANLQYSSSDKGVTKEKYYVENEIDYSFKDPYQQFLFLDTHATFDKFSPYDYVWVVAAGYGLNLVQRGRFTLSAQAGPGNREVREYATQQVTNYPIVNTKTTATFLLDKTGGNKLSEVLTYNIGKPYDSLTSLSSVTMKLKTHFSAVFSYQVDYTSKIPAGDEHTSKVDMTTTANLVFTY